MMDSGTVKVVVMAAERLVNSPSGNPVWRITTSAGTWRTGTDSQVGFTTWEQNVSIDAGRVSDMKIALAPASSPPASTD